MSNVYYTPTGEPRTNAQAQSSAIRTEFVRIATAFDKIGSPSPANKFVRVSVAATGWENYWRYESGNLSNCDFIFTGSNGNLVINSKAISGSFVKIGPIHLFQYLVQVNYTQTTASGPVRVLFNDVTLTPGLFTTRWPAYVNSINDSNLQIVAEALNYGDGAISLAFYKCDLAAGTVTALDETTLTGGNFEASGTFIIHSTGI